MLEGGLPVGAPVNIRSAELMDASLTRRSAEMQMLSAMQTTK